MHELSLANNIIDQITEAATSHGAKKILSVRVLMGPLSGVEWEPLDFCFSESCKGTMAEGATLVLEKSPLQINCVRCKKTSEVSPHDLHCPHCHAFEIVVMSGKEFRIIDLEVC